MLGLCGWYGEAPEREDPTELLDSMAARVALHAPDCDHRRAAGGLALCAMGATGKADLRCHGALWAAIEGSYRWDDPALAAEAVRRGNAAALIEAYRRDGARAAENLCGRFSFAVLDDENGRALAATDRFASRPVVFATIGKGTIVFGSTADGVRAHGGVEASIDPRLVFRSLQRGPGSTSTSVFAGLRRLGPEEAVVFEAGRGARISRHDRRSRDDVARPDATADIMGDLRLALDQSIARCAEPGGRNASVMLFHGDPADSAIVAALRAGGDVSVRTYAAVFPDPEAGGPAHARAMARRLGAEHSECLITYGDIEAVAPRVAATLDEPVGFAWTVTTHCLARIAGRDGFDMLMSGEGGEALLAGIGRYGRALSGAPPFVLPAWLRFAGGDTEIAGLLFALREKLRRGLRPGARPTGIAPSGLTDDSAHPHRALFADLMSPEILARFGDADRREDGADALHPDVSSLGGIDAVSARHRVAEVATACALAGIRAEFPFLDDDLIGTAEKARLASLGDEWPLGRTLERALHGILPGTGPAQFGSPHGFAAWRALRDYSPLREMACDCLASLARRDIFNARYLDALRDDAFAGRLAQGDTLAWDLMMLELWWQAHVDASGASVPGSRVPEKV